MVSKMICISIQRIYTSLRLAAWATVGLMCLLCGCGSDTSSDAYENVAAQMEHKRAMLENLPLLDTPRITEICLYVNAACLQSQIRRDHVAVKQTAKCRSNLARQSTACQITMIALHECLADNEAEALRLDPTALPRINMSACPSYEASVFLRCELGASNED